MPGRLTNSHYMLNGWYFPGRVSGSPLVKLDPAGPQVKGPAGITRAGVRATVGDPLPLSVWTTRDEAVPGDRRPINLKWVKHQGPGDVTFRQTDLRVATETWAQAGADGARAITEATFSEPGDYVLRVLAYNRVGEFEFQCCWTNGYVEVTVTR